MTQQATRETKLTMPLRQFRHSLAALLPAVDRSSAPGSGVARLQNSAEDPESVEFAANNRSLAVRVLQRCEGAAMHRPLYLPALRMERYARLLEGEAVTLGARAERNVLSLRCGGTVTRFGTDRGDAFPVTVQAPETKDVRTSLQTLALMLRYVLFQSRQECKALLEVDGANFHLTYTDGARLARYTALQGGFAKALRVMVPEPLLAALAKVAGAEGQNGLCTFSVSDEGVSVVVSGMADLHLVHMTHKVASGQFPNYKAILPTKAEGSVMLPTAAILAAVRRCADFSSDVVSLTVSPREVKLRGSDAVIGETEDTLPASSSFDFAPVQVALNAGYLRDVLQRIEGDVALSVAKIGDQRGLWIVHHPAEFERFEYVLMGIRSR